MVLCSSPSVTRSPAEASSRRDPGANPDAGIEDETDQCVVLGVDDRHGRGIRSPLVESEPLGSQHQARRGSLHRLGSGGGLCLDGAERAAHPVACPAPAEFDGVADEARHPAARRALVDVGGCSPLRYAAVSHHGHMVGE